MPTLVEFRRRLPSGSCRVTRVGLMKIFFGEVGKPSAVKQQIHKERPGDIKAPSQEKIRPSLWRDFVGSTIRFNAASVFCYASTAFMNSLVKDFDVARVLLSVGLLHYSL